MPVSALAEIATDSLTPDTQKHSWTHTVNAEGLYIDLPSVDYNQLINLIRTSHVQLTQREQEITKYLDDNQMNSKDAVIAAILPGGLLYAAVRKNNLEQAKTRLAKVNEMMDDLSYDLLAMQANMNTFTMAQLQ
jgi:hypothetical protein